MNCSQCKKKTNSLHHQGDDGLCDNCFALTFSDHFKCNECGNPYHLSMTGAELRPGLCFNCDFWQEKVDWTNDPDQKDRCVRVNKRHYHISEGLTGGYGGRSFKIRFFDGRVVEHNNLWLQGDIPKHFQKRLPNNAEFLST